MSGRKLLFRLTHLKLSWNDAAAVPFSLDDVYAIDFGPASGNAPMDIWIDDIDFYKNMGIGDSLVFDDFEDLDMNNLLWGGPWLSFTDGDANSTIQGEMNEFAGYDNSNASVHVWGKYLNYGGFASLLNKEGTDVDLKGINGFSFYAMGDSANPVYIRLRERKAENERSYNYFGYKFIPTTEWKLYSVPFDSLTLVYGGETTLPFSTEDIYAFDIGPASGNEDIDVYVDNVIFWRENNTVDVKSTNKILPEKYVLAQNYPNPFNPTTTINFSIVKNGFVTLKVYDTVGREITTLVNKEMNAGTYNINFNASHLTSGIYLYKLNVNGLSLTNKMLLLK